MAVAAGGSRNVLGPMFFITIHAFDAARIFPAASDAATGQWCPVPKAFLTSRNRPALAAAPVIDRVSSIIAAMMAIIKDAFADLAAIPFSFLVLMQGR